MAAPLKPWEVAMSGSIPNGSIPYVPNNTTGRLHSSALPYPGTTTGGGGGIASQQIPSTLPPPLPPRVGQTRPLYSAYNRSSIMPYSATYGGGYSGPYGSGGLYSSPYNSYSNYGSSYGMNPYGNRPFGGYGQLEDPSFSQMAEESASPAFQSIESFVGAFCSVSAMLESTFHALYSSFRAVIGVADHLGRVKQILSALTIFKFFKWVFRRFLYLIGISKIKPADVESLWNNLSSDTSSSSGDALEVLQSSVNKPSSWPILMFLGFIFAGPYVMWKLVKSLNFDPSEKDKRKWATGESEHFIAICEYQFVPMGDRELELKPGQVIRLAPSKFQPANVKGWVLASDGQKIGLVPTNYIKIKGKKSRDQFPLNQPQLLFSQPNSVVASPEKRQSHHQRENVNKIDGNCTSESSSFASGGATADSAISSDDDTDTLVGEPIDE